MYITFLILLSLHISHYSYVYYIPYLHISHYSYVYYISYYILVIILMYITFLITY